MKDIIIHLLTDFNGKVKIEMKREGIFQLYLHIFHEDGDMIDLFIQEVKGNKYKLCDFGLTLQRLSYTYDIDSDNKEAIFQRILKENDLKEDDGNIYTLSSKENIFQNIMHITQAFAKIGSMKYFKREVIESLFYEILDEFIYKELIEYNPVSKVLPIPDRGDLEADYQFSPNGTPIYLFGVKDHTKAKLATISCLEFQKAKLNFRGWVVNDDFEKLPKNDRSRLTNTCDKQFTTLDDFKKDAKEFLQRER